MSGRWRRFRFGGFEGLADCGMSTYQRVTVYSRPLSAVTSRPINAVQIIGFCILPMILPHARLSYGAVGRGSKLG